MQYPHWVGEVALRTSVVCAVFSLWLQPARADLIKVRYPEGPTHGFVVLSDLDDQPLAYGEMNQWLDGELVANRLLFRFNDGSIHDEQLKFSQQPFLRLESYRLLQKGPAFPESSEVSFDRTGRYESRTWGAPDQEEKRDSGKIDIPDDVVNGLTSTVLKNLERGAAAKTHMIAFDPKPHILELDIAPVGSEPYTLGQISGKARHFVMRPRVTGLTGVVATVIGKQPSPYSMWLTDSGVPVLIRFEGMLCADGPVWRIGVGAPNLGSSAKKP